MIDQLFRLSSIGITLGCYKLHANGAKACMQGVFNLPSEVDNERGKSLGLGLVLVRGES